MTNLCWCKLNNPPIKFNIGVNRIGEANSEESFTFTVHEAGEKYRLHSNGYWSEVGQRVTLWKTVKKPSEIFTEDEVRTELAELDTDAVIDLRMIMGAVLRTHPGHTAEAIAGLTMRNLVAEIEWYPDAIE